MANPRNLRMIADSIRKSDQVDAHMLARLARVDPKLLSPIAHRKQEIYPDIIQLKARDLLVKNRTRLMNAVRGVLKSAGLRVPNSGTSCFPSKAAACIPDELKLSLTPLLETISHLNKQIYSLDKAIETTAQNRYPETNRLRQISGVGSITALQYVLTIGDPGPVRSFQRCPCISWADTTSPPIRLGRATTQDQQGRQQTAPLSAGSVCSISVGTFWPG